MSDLVRHEEAPLHQNPLPSDQEIERFYRLAKAFAMAKIYKDVQQAEQAFAKLIIGHDLGLSVAQSMQAVQFVRGQIQLHYATLALVIRARGFRWEPLERSDTRAAAKFFDPEGTYLDTVEFTLEDANRAGLTKASPKGEPSMYTKYPRNMLWARMMSDAVRFVIPEATGGVPVYTPGEIVSVEALSEGEGTDEPQGVPLPDSIEQIIAKAEGLGHPSLANRAVWEMQSGRPAPDVEQLVREAQAELAALEAKRNAEAEAPPDADVVDDVSADMREVPIDDADLPEPTPLPAATVIEYHDIPGKNERWYAHVDCDGVGASWVAPRDDVPAPQETDCPQCGQTFPVVTTEQVKQWAANVEVIEAESVDKPNPVAEVSVDVPKIASAIIKDPDAGWGTGANAPTVEQLRAQRKLYEDMKDEVKPEEQDRYDQEVNALDAKLADLARQEADDNQEQGSLL